MHKQRIRKEDHLIGDRKEREEGMNTSLVSTVAIILVAANALGCTLDCQVGGQ